MMCRKNQRVKSGNGNLFEGLEKNEDIETLAQLTTLVTLCNYVCASLCYFDGGLGHLALRMEFSGKKRREG